MHSQNQVISYKLFKNHKNLLAFTTVINSISICNPRYTGDNSGLYGESRNELSKIIGLSEGQLVFPRQTHTNHVESINLLPDIAIKETDALVSDKSNICLCVQTADCVPILLFDPVRNVISAIHAGWRGTVGKIVDHALAKMKMEYHSEPKNVQAVIGPSISPEVYEVGDEVVKEVKDSIPNFERTLSINSFGKHHLNLWEANRQLLLNSGLQEENIETLGECSYMNSDKYFSARRDGIQTGRMVSGIMLKN